VEGLNERARRKDFDSRWVSVIEILRQLTNGLIISPAIRGDSRGEDEDSLNLEDIASRLWIGKMVAARLKIVVGNEPFSWSDYALGRRTESQD